MRKTGIALAAVLLVGALAAAFWRLDFRAAMSEFGAQSQVGTYESMVKKVEGLQPKHDVAVYVEGEDALAASVREELARQLEASPYFAKVENLDTLPGQAGGQIVVVELDEDSQVWTPVYAHTEMVVKLAYATDGEVSWRGRKPVVMTSDGGPTIRLDGELQIEDTTRGLVSYAGYQRQLGQQIAGALSKTLQNAVAGKAI